MLPGIMSILNLIPFPITQNKNYINVCPTIYSLKPTHPAPWLTPES